MMKRKHTESPSGDYRQQKGGTSGYFGDFKLLSRVRQYLKAHNHKNVNTYVMAEDLQRQYGEYARKKKNAFYRMVDRAYNHIDHGKMSDNASRLEEQHLKKKRATTPSCSESDDDVIEDIEGDSVESFSPENEEYVAYRDFNSMNNMMSNIYRNMPSSSHANPAAVVITNSREDKSGNDNCITIDDSSDSDTNVENEMKKDKTSFFIDRSGEGNKNMSNRSVKVNSNDSDLLISCSTPVLGTASELQDRLPVFDSNIDSNTPPSYKADKISPHKRKNKMVSVPESDKKKFSVSTMHHGKQISVQRESRNTDTSNISLTSDKTENGVSEKMSNSKLPKEKSSQKNKKAKKDSDVETTKKGPEVQSSSVTFRDVGGNDKSLLEICKLLVHMRHPEVYKQLGMTPPRGFLLHGPPGCGKTLLAHAIAGELDLPFIKIAATEVVSGVSGESEEKIRDLFDKAVMAAPCILFIDEIDAITPKRETASKDMERRIVAQLLSCMDDLAGKVDVHVLVIGATNRPDSIDPALRRAGRFDKEISLGIPDEPARARILQVLCRTLTLSADFDFQYLARNSPGYVGADLSALAREAAINAVNRVFNDLQKKKLEIDTGLLGKQIDQGSTGNIEHIEGSSANKDSEKKSTEKDTDAKICGDDSRVVSETDVKQDEGDVMETKTTNCENVPDIDITNVEMKSVGIECKTENENHDITTEEAKCTIQDRSRKDESKDKPVTVLSELQTVLGWLKDRPPLTEAQLQSLCITMDDFKEALKFVQPSAMREGFATVPDVTWDNIGALHSVREDLQLAILAPVRHAEEFSSLGLTRAQGILLAGPPGCGKTLLAKAIANESGINFISVKGPELLNMYVGESERAVRQVFQRARNSTPCVIFFDELDALCPRRSNAGEGGASVRVVNQMLTEMDGLEERKQVFIMGATNRPDIIDPAILRPGRLDKCLFVGMPSADDRHDILKTITKRGTKPKLSEDVCLEEVANDSRCQGFTGADLAALVREASVSALKSVISCKEINRGSLEVTKQHFDDAFVKVKPSVTKKEQERYEKLSNSTKVTPTASDTTT